MWRAKYTFGTKEECGELSSLLETMVQDEKISWPNFKSKTGENTIVQKRRSRLDLTLMLRYCREEECSQATTTAMWLLELNAQVFLL